MEEFQSAKTIHPKTTNAPFDAKSKTATASSASVNQPSHLLVSGADFSVELQRLLRLLEFAAVQQVGADHDAGAALPRLAVDGGHVQFVLAQPLVQVLAERLDKLQLGGVVVLKWELSHCGGGRKRRDEGGL